jgi:beta-galactosidase
MTASERSLGFEQPIQLAKAEWFGAAYDGLSESGFPFLISDTALARERWDRFKAVVVSSFEFMAADVQRKLVDYAAAGGTVVLGPQLPHLDERMRPDDTLRRAVEAGQGRFVQLADLSDAPAAFDAALGGLGLVRFTRNDPRLDVAIHAPEDDDGRRIVYVANPSAETIDAEVSLTPGVTFVRELWEDRAVGATTTLREELAPYTITIYEGRL